MTRNPPAPSLEAYLLGLVDFEDVQKLQRRLVYEQAERAGAALLVCEHPPTLSVGRLGSRAHVAEDDDALAAMGIKTFWVNRGGGCVLHLPGQLACYFVMPLGLRGLSPMAYVRGLQDVVLRTLEEFDLRGVVRSSPHGIYLGEARVASIGVAINRGIAYHGFTLNVGPYLDLFDVLSEPGLSGGPLRQTSMEARRQRPTLMSKVREAIVRRTEMVFGLDRSHLYTHHPQLRRKVLSHAYAPSPG
jgi:lipoyl(octanoyl) transferase